MACYRTTARAIRHHEAFEDVMRVCVCVCAQVKALQEQLSSLSASLADRTSADMSALDKRCESTEGQIKDIEGKV